jgi:hypothetical protein
VAHNQVWTYRLDRETIADVTLAQTSDTTWLLTKAGVRPIKTADIRLIDGPFSIAEHTTAHSRDADPRYTGCCLLHILRFIVLSA